MTSIVFGSLLVEQTSFKYWEISRELVQSTSTAFIKGGFSMNLHIFAYILTTQCVIYVCREQQRKWKTGDKGLCKEGKFAGNSINASVLTIWVDDEQHISLDDGINQ